MVRLDCPDSHQHVSPGGKCITHKILELTSLIATTFRSGKVIPFHPYTRNADGLAEVSELVHWSWQERQRSVRVFFETRQEVRQSAIVSHIGFLSSG